MSIEGRTERTTNELSPVEQGHACPHGGAKWVWSDGDFATAQWCGKHGWLCPVCREDKADARTDRLVEGLALAGLLANPTMTARGDTPVAVSWAREAASALRDGIK